MSGDESDNLNFPQPRASSSNEPSLATFRRPSSNASNQSHEDNLKKSTSNRSSVSGSSGSRKSVPQINTNLDKRPSKSLSDSGSSSNKIKDDASVRSSNNARDEQKSDGVVDESTIDTNLAQDNVSVNTVSVSGVNINVTSVTLGTTPKTQKDLESATARTDDVKSDSVKDGTRDSKTDLKLDVVLPGGESKDAENSSRRSSKASSGRSKSSSNRSNSKRDKEADRRSESQKSGSEKPYDPDAPDLADNLIEMSKSEDSSAPSAAFPISSGEHGGAGEDGKSGKRKSDLPTEVKVKDGLLKFEEKDVTRAVSSMSGRMSISKIASKESLMKELEEQGIKPPEKSTSFPADVEGARKKRKNSNANDFEAVPVSLPPSSTSFLSVRG